MKENQKRWVKAIVISLLILGAISVYLFARQGYFNLSIANKAFASTAVVLAGVALLMGPLSRRITSLARYMTIRRQLGLSAFIFAAFHIVASLLQQQSFQFPKWYLNEWLPVSMGLLAILVWGYLAYLSRDSKIQKMGGLQWIKHLSSGAQIAFFAVFLHLGIMKYEGWIRWWNGQVQKSAQLANPSYPPANLLVFLFMLAIIVFRIFTYFRHK